MFNTIFAEYKEHILNIWDEFNWAEHGAIGFIMQPTDWVLRLIFLSEALHSS
jgi:hypothetical protein